jgi:hypothetical protein
VCGYLEVLVFKNKGIVCGIENDIAVRSKDLKAKRIGRIVEYIVVTGSDRTALPNKKVGSFEPQG